MSAGSYTIEAIGIVRSELTRREDAPRQGDEGGPEAWLEISAEVAEGLVGIAVADELMLLTWLHLAQRDVLQVHPRGDPNRPLTGDTVLKVKRHCALWKESADQRVVQI